MFTFTRSSVTSFPYLRIFNHRHPVWELADLTARGQDGLARTIRKVNFLLSRLVMTLHLHTGDKTQTAHTRIQQHTHA